MPRQIKNIKMENNKPTKNKAKEEQSQGRLRPVQSFTH
jgi:hypothetical protein